MMGYHGISWAKDAGGVCFPEAGCFEQKLENQGRLLAMAKQRHPMGPPHGPHWPCDPMAVTTMMFPVSHGRPWEDKLSYIGKIPSACASK